MLSWATEELEIRRAEAQSDWGAPRVAAVQAEADKAALQQAAAGALEDAEFRRRMEAKAAGWRRQMAEEAARQAARDARVAALARVFANLEEALAEAKAIFNSLREQ